MCIRDRYCVLHQDFRDCSQTVGALNETVKKGNFINISWKDREHDTKDPIQTLGTKHGNIKRAQNFKFLCEILTWSVSDIASKGLLKIEKKEGTFLRKIVGSRKVSVSYTHLDVYKRQTWYFICSFNKICYHVFIDTL